MRKRRGALQIPIPVAVSSIDLVSSYGSSYTKERAFVVPGKGYGLVYEARGLGIVPRYGRIGATTQG